LIYEFDLYVLKVYLQTNDEDSRQVLSSVRARK